MEDFTFSENAVLKMIEFGKINSFLTMMKATTGNNVEPLERLLFALVRNGCSADVVIKSLAESGKEIEENERNSDAM